MHIASVTPFSLIDYPGKVSCIVFTLGCNLRCKYCYNSEFVLPEYREKVHKNCIPEEVFFNFLEKRSGFLDGVSICGGEPTLQKDLAHFCHMVKDAGFLVKIDTNGVSPMILSNLIDEKCVDYLAMDIKHTFLKYKDIVGKEEDMSFYKESIKIIMDSGIDYEFRTTCVSGVHMTEDIAEIAQSIQGAKKFVLQNFRAGNLLDPNFIGEVFPIKEMEGFKKVAEKYVKKVEVRL